MAYNQTFKGAIEMNSHTPIHLYEVENKKFEYFKWVASLSWEFHNRD